MITGKQSYWKFPIHYSVASHGPYEGHVITITQTDRMRFHSLMAGSRNPNPAGYVVSSDSAIPLSCYWMFTVGINEELLSIIAESERGPNLNLVWPNSGVRVGFTLGIL